MLAYDQRVPPLDELQAYAQLRGRPGIVNETYIAACRRVRELLLVIFNTKALLDFTEYDELVLMSKSGTRCGHDGDAESRTCICTQLSPPP